MARLPAAPATPARAAAYELGIEHLPASVPGQAASGVPRLGWPAASCLRVRCTLYELDRLPEAGVDPMIGAARYVTATTPGSAFQAGSRMVSGARLAHGQAAIDLEAAIERGELRRAKLLAEQVEALPPETTLRFRFLLASEATRGVILGLLRHGSAEGARVLVGLQAPPPGAATASVLPERELLLLEPELRPGEPLVLLLPAGPALRAPSALVLAMDRAPADGAAARAHVTAADAAWHSLRATESAGPASAAPGGLSLQLHQQPGAAERLAAVVWLCGMVGAPMARQAAMLGDERLVATLAAAPDVTAEPRPGFDRQRMAWALERAALEQLARSARDGELDLALRGLLRAWVGEAAADPEALLSIVEGCRGAKALEAQLVAENQAHLGDPDPSVRARAFDWLAEREKAPPGFDPLGPAAERRRALAKVPAPEPAPAEDGR